MSQKTKGKSSPTGITRRRKPGALELGQALPVILTDINEDGLKRAQSGIRAVKGPAEAVRLNVTDRKDIPRQRRHSSAITGQLIIADGGITIW